MGNALIFPLEFYDATFRIVPPAWSVAVELINYGLLWLLIARNRWVALAVLLASLLFHAWVYQQDPAWSLRYRPFEAALLPFSTGAVIYYCKSWTLDIPLFQLKWLCATSAIFWSANLIACGVTGSFESATFTLFFYLNLLSLAVLVLSLSHPYYSSVSKGVAKTLGDLAYPVFLLHWISGFVVYKAFGLNEPRGWNVLLLATPLILLFSWVAVRLTSRGIEPLRDKIRQRSRRSAH